MIFVRTTVADEEVPSPARTAHPRPHTLRALLATGTGNADQDFDELLANCALLLIAGHETTTHFIGNSALALLRHPQAADQLRSRVDLIPPPSRNSCGTTARCS